MQKLLLQEVDVQTHLDRRILQRLQKEQRISHLILHTLTFQVFCASIFTTQKGPTVSAKQFQVLCSASNRTTLCHCKWEQRDMVCLSRCNLTCKRAALIYISAVSWTRLISSVKVPLKIIWIFLCYPYRSQLQIFQEKNFGGESVYHGSSNLPVACRKGKSSSQPVSLHWQYCGERTLSPTQSLWAKPVLPPLHQFLLQLSHCTVNFTILQMQTHRKGSLGEHSMKIAKA